MPKTKATKLSEVTHVDAEDVNAEEQELIGFLDSLGVSGISEVALYRILSNGKQRFVTAGPPAQFSEQGIQTVHGGGDYLIRARLNGRWFRSKTISVEGPLIGEKQNGAGHDDLDRLKLDLESQRLRLQEQHAQMEADRQARDQRNHELQLALIESSRHTTAPPVTVTDLITGLKNLKELSGNQDEILGGIEKSLGIIERISNIRGAGNAEGGGGWIDWLKPVVSEAGKQLLPKVLPFLAPGASANGTTPGTMGSTPAPPVPPAPAPMPEIASAPEPPVPTPTPEEQYQFNKIQALQYILPIARMGRDPEFWAENTIEQIETTNNPVIARMVDEMVKAESFEAWFRDLQKLEPTVITSPRWFELFFNAMRDIIHQKSEESDMK